MGASSSAEVSSVGGFKEDSIALALFASDIVDVTVGLGTGLGEDVDAACRVGGRPGAGRIGAGTPGSAS